MRIRTWPGRYQTFLPLTTSWLCCQGPFSLSSIEEVNTRGRRGTPSIDWSRSYGWDPRWRPGNGPRLHGGGPDRYLHASWPWRRQRRYNTATWSLLGYKRPYLGYCRTYLEQDVLTAFGRIRRARGEMRRQLSASSRCWRPSQRLEACLRPIAGSATLFEATSSSMTMLADVTLMHGLHLAWSLVPECYR